MKVQLVGCSHHRSSVQVRERLAFNAAQAASALTDLRSRFPQSEAVLLSTCNRVELYLACEEAVAAPTHQDVAHFMADFHGVAIDEVFDELFERDGEDAVLHLFTVAASLDSMVVGEPQILSQVKQAYDLAQDQGSVGPLTHAIFQAAQRVAKRVASETTIQQKRVSIPSVAVNDFASSIFEDFADKAVLVIGAGEMGEETLQYLVGAGAKHITVVNRNFERGAELAQRYGGHALPWSALMEQVTAADLIVSTTGATEPVVTLADFRRIEAARFQRTLLVLDLAIPRDFDPAIGDSLGVYLYSIDDLREACDRNRKQREQELPNALGIVQQEVSKFMAELYHRPTGPIIQRLKQGWQRPKEDELHRLFNKLPDLDERSRREITLAFDRLMNKLLHPPLESLRDEARDGVPHGLLDALKRLFQLKD